MGHYPAWLTAPSGLRADSPPPGFAPSALARSLRRRAAMRAAPEKWDLGNEPVGG